MSSAVRAQKPPDGCGQRLHIGFGVVDAHAGAAGARVQRAKPLVHGGSTVQPGAQGEAVVGQRVAQLAGVHGGGHKADYAHLGRGGVAQHAHAAQGGQTRAQVARQGILVLLNFLPVRQREARSNQQARRLAVPLS